MNEATRPDGIQIRTVTPPPTVRIRTATPPPTEQRVERTEHPEGTVTTIEICDGAIEIGPIKTCLNEFGAVQSIGIVAAIAFLIILWRKLK